MKQNKTCKSLIILLLVFISLFNSIISAYALQSDRELFEELDSSNTFIVARVEDGYPAQYLDIAILDNNGKTIKELRLLYFEMYKKWITLPEGEYTIVGIDLIDEKNYPVESVTFTVDKSGGSAEINVGPKVAEQLKESEKTTTTEPNAIVVEKETTTTQHIEGSTSSIIKVEDTLPDDEKTVGEKLTDFGTNLIFIIIAVFVLIIVGGFVILVYLKKKNEKY